MRQGSTLIGMELGGEYSYGRESPHLGAAQGKFVERSVPGIWKMKRGKCMRWDENYEMGWDGMVSLVWDRMGGERMGWDGMIWGDMGKRM